MTRSSGHPDFTRQHFNRVAETIRTAPVSEKDRAKLAHHFAQNLADTNPNFDYDRFVQASGGQDLFNDRRDQKQSHYARLVESGLVDQ